MSEIEDKAAKAASVANMLDSYCNNLEAILNTYGDMVWVDFCEALDLPSSSNAVDVIVKIKDILKLASNTINDTSVKLPEKPSDDICDTLDDKVNNPQHYKHGTLETFDEMRVVFGDERVRDFCICNAWKYRARAKYKGNEEEDLKKADWYINAAHALGEGRMAMLTDLSNSDPGNLANAQFQAIKDYDDESIEMQMNPFDNLIGSIRDSFMEATNIGGKVAEA